MKAIREIWKENASEFKWIINICVNFLAFSLNDFNFKMEYSRKNQTGGSGYEIATRISRGYLKTIEFLGMIKKKLCGISRCLGFRPWWV